MPRTRLERWGLGADVEAAAEAGAEVGRVVQVDRGECDVITASRVRRVVSDPMRVQLDVAPVTGDWVQLMRVAQEWLMKRVLPRRTALTRRNPTARDAEQVLAANIDVVGIVAGLDRPLPPGRFERLLIMARDSEAETLVLLTKADRARSRVAAERVADVQALVGDVPVLSLSIKSGLGVADLGSRIGAGRTLVLVGASGSGKSSLVNALAGTEVVDTGKVRASDRRGRHTTIARRLVKLPGDAGLVLDTPGLRALGLPDAKAALEEVFDDIEDLSWDCRFADCAHKAEPDCAVTEAVESGAIDPRRVLRYEALRDEIERRTSRSRRYR